MARLPKALLLSATVPLAFLRCASATNACVAENDGDDACALQVAARMPEPEPPMLLTDLLCEDGFASIPPRADCVELSPNGNYYRPEPRPQQKPRKWPNARFISDVLHEGIQKPPVSAAGITVMTMGFGQFVDHTLALFAEFHGVCKHRDCFLPICHHSTERPISARDCDKRQPFNLKPGTMKGVPAVYGVDEQRQEILREGRDGLLKTKDNLPPPVDEDTDDMANSYGFMTEEMRLSKHPGFLCGDERCNENPLLLAIHALFVREHNRIARVIKLNQPHLSDQDIFEHAKKINSGKIQKITLYDMIARLVGRDLIPPYTGHKPGTDARLSKTFVGAAYRFGHTLIPESFLMISENHSSKEYFPLNRTFENPEPILKRGLSWIFRGAASDAAPELDVLVNEFVRNDLQNSGIDLLSTNIARARELGVPSFVGLQEIHNLPRARSFANITSDKDLQRRLAKAYESVDDVDPWVGLMAEDHRQGAQMGPTLATIIADQFIRIRDADPTWFENEEGHVLPKGTIDAIRRQTLADIIRRNTEVKCIQHDVFVLPSVKSCPTGCCEVSYYYH